MRYYYEEVDKTNLRATRLWKSMIIERRRITIPLKTGLKDKKSNFYSIIHKFKLIQQDL